MSNVGKYLSRYSEPEAHALLDFPPTVFEYCVVIPVRDEKAYFLQQFVERFSDNTNPILLILVINQPNTQYDTTLNAQLAAKAKNVFARTTWCHQHLSLHSHSNCHLLIVDRYSRTPIPADQGVGLARKIGADIACSLYHTQQLNNALVLSTDADAQLPSHYFSACQQHNPQNTSAVVFDFTHIKDTDDQNDPCFNATQLYEKALKYFRRGLDFAGSPYAFYTLGSTLGFSIEQYCQARGFPKRAGGEDFYLLNKLAKLGTVHFQHEICISITARESDRVPFGTGPAVAKIRQLDNPSEDYCYYHPAVFSCLKQWLALLPTFWAALDTGENPATCIPAALNSAARAVNSAKFFEHAIRQCRSFDAFCKQFHQWFDAFITLKFIHHLQQSLYPAQPLLPSIQTLNNHINDSCHD